MPINITMPALSPTMTEGNLSKWLKKEGDVVKSGDVIAEIETDKATMEVESADEGTLSKIVVPAGSEAVKVGALIALMLEEGESASDIAAPAPKPAAPAAVKTPAAPVAAPSLQASPQTAAVNGRIFVSPLARRLAAESGLKLDTITGSGPHGRIVKADIEAARAAAPPEVAPKAEPAASAPAPKPASAPAAAGNGKDRIVGLAGNIPYEFTPHTSMRKTIARRLTEAKQTVPHFYLTIDSVIDDLLKVRRELNEKARDRFKLSVNDFVIRASALALREVPECNASFSDEGTLIWRQVDIAVAVAIEGGLITPIVKQADNKGLADISNAMRDLGARAKAGKLKPDEYQGGTFSISNLGMFGIREFAAVINPPHGAILAVGAGEERPVVKNGALAIATVMTSTLSVDHRVVDGAAGAKFLQAFKRLIEDPLTMLL